MSDLIDRQAAIDAATKFRVNPGGEIFEAIRRAVRSELELVPSAQQWIPCSERLPEEDCKCIVTIRFKRTDGFQEYAVDSAKFDTDFECFITDTSWWGVESIDAWMPLPQPYKGGQDE